MDTNPYQFLKPVDQRRIFILVLLITLLLVVLNNFINAPLVTAAAPYGIISYELARTSQNALLILESWDELAREHAAFGLGFDYLFMVAYAISIGLACVLSAGALRRRRWPLVGLGFLLAWALWIAASLDAVENIALVTMLFGNISDSWPAIAYWCAMVKFGLVFAGMIYAFYGLVVWLIIREGAQAA